MVFDELNDAEWAAISTLISDEQEMSIGERRGRPRIHTRDVTNAVLWILTTGRTWSELPNHFPSGPTCRRRLAQWRANGVLEKMARILAQSGRELPSTKKFTHPSPDLPVSSTPSHQHANASIASLISNDSERKISMLQCVMRCSSEFVGPEGYVICAGYDVLCNGTYRAWSELKKDRLRIERSGLIGPRFPNADAAEQYALAWAQQWLVNHGYLNVVDEASCVPMSDNSLDPGCANTAHPPYQDASCSRTLQLSEV
jgi:transposase